MENYFDVPKFLTGQESDVKVLGGISTPGNSCAGAHGQLA